jgi:NAD(P)-dependent dehydrogenase (short-subunit alcohol dehydrogenase family)
MAVYVVTGGTGALGSAVVRLLLARGHDVTVPYRERARLDALKAALPQADRLYGEAAEMDRVDQAERLMAAVANRAGGVDGVAALAGGYASSGLLEVAPPHEWDEMLRVNLATTYATCRAAVPHLAASHGAIVTCSSRAVVTGGAGAAYTVSKAGVEALTRELALETRARGIRVNAIAPGTIDTAANRHAMANADMSAWTPAEEIAEVVTFLLSPESAPITGAVLPVHGRRAVDRG